MAFPRLVRAYAPCVVPHDQTIDGLPACSPPVSSPCDFRDAAVRISAPRNDSLDRVTFRPPLRRGSGSCRDGQYSLQFDVRVTADDAACAGGSCTFEDLTLSRSFTPGNSIVNFELAELFPVGFDQANLEIRRVAMIDPDGIPLATTGVREDHSDFSRVESNLTFANDACESPTTTGALGPACAPPAHAGSCDYDHGTVEWEGRARKGLLWKAEARNLVGGPECADGTYHLQSTLRITTPRCGDGTVPCTLVDVPIDFPIVAKHGRLKGKRVTPGVSLPRDHVEVRDVRLVEPSGSTLATTGVGHALRLQKTKITVVRGTADPNDDALRITTVLPTKKIDPIPAGVSVTVRDRDGVAYTATIPGNLWQTNRAGWSYEDHSGSIAGIRRAKIRGAKITLAAFGTSLGAADQLSETLEITIGASINGGILDAAQNRSCRVKPSGLHCR